MSKHDLIQIDFEPVGKRVEVESGGTVLAAAQHAGIQLSAICGGNGTCGACRIQILNGEVSPISKSEKPNIGTGPGKEGWRFACQVIANSDLRVFIPPESLTTPQRTQVEGNEGIPLFQRSFHTIDVQLNAPNLSDIRSDSKRLIENIRGRINESTSISTEVLIHCSDFLRKSNWQCRAIIRKEKSRLKITNLIPFNSIPLGLAVDIGTTKLAVYLLDMETGKILARRGEMNPQISFGEDVISRIVYANESQKNANQLQAQLIHSINTIAKLLCREMKVIPLQIIEACFVGNTVMHHLALNLPVEQLGLSPYVPAITEAVNIDADRIGLDISIGGRVYFPPNLAGYVGGDHVAVLLATQAWKSKKNILTIDIGTNTEISLLVNEQLFCCSCASGPAFEGAHISMGMRASSGAIEKVNYKDGQFQFAVIDNKPAVGFCGSGILDAVAALKIANVIDNRGVFKHDLNNSKEKGFKLIESGRNFAKRDIVITRSDINQIQLAKAAIRTGIETLIHYAGIDPQELDLIIVAGAFGTYLSLESAIEIGMFPKLPLSKFQQVGNAAGMGARRLLIANAERKIATKIAEKMQYIELTNDPNFSDNYMKALYI